MANDFNDGLPETDGRRAQKLRTRRKLLRAAQEMMARQEAITVGAVAKQAGISVATAYRHFSDPESIRLEAVVEMNLGQRGDFMADLQARCEGVTSVVDRVLAAQKLMTEFVAHNEDAYRLFIAKGHEQLVAHRGKNKPAPRGGRRLPMIEFALEPWRGAMPAPDFRKIVQTVTTVCGTESYFVLRDLCNLAVDDIAQVSEDAVRRVVESLAKEFGLPE